MGTLAEPPGITHPLQGHTPGAVSVAVSEGKIAVSSVLCFPSCSSRSVDFGSGVFLVFPWHTPSIVRWCPPFPLPPLSIPPCLPPLAGSPALAARWKGETRRLVQVWAVEGTAVVFVWDLPLCPLRFHPFVVRLFKGRHSPTRLCAFPSSAPQVWHC